MISALLLIAQGDGARTTSGSGMVANVASFGKQIHSRKGPVEALEAVVTNLAAPLHDLGYRIETQSDQGVTFKASAWRSGILRFGQRITMSFADAPDGGTYVTIAGEGPGRVVRQFKALDLDDIRA